MILNYPICDYYYKICKKYGLEELKQHEKQIEKDFGKFIFRKISEKSISSRLKNDGKIDVIIHGQRTISSSYLAIDKEQ